MTKVGYEIKRRREESGMSQNQLAKRAGIAQSTLSAIEKTTKSPSAETLIAIANALGCTVAELMGETGQEGGNNAEEQLIRIFRQLNNDGQDELLKRAREMTQLPQWIEKSAVRYG